MKIAVVRIRGVVGTNVKEKITMKCLNLEKRNNCIVIEDTPVYRGMILKVKHLVTWGRIDKETFTMMFAKRARMEGNKRITMSEKEIKSFVDDFFEGKKSLKDIHVLPYFRLTPAKKGYGHKGVKQPFSLGGALGPRLDKMNELLRRMI